MRTLVIIPARYASSRFPGKPLALIAGRSMIDRVIGQVGLSGVADRLVVATDDERIARHVRELGREAMMTSPDHLSGTDRCGEVVSLLEEQGDRFDLVINVQGDEPGLPPHNLGLLREAFSHPDVSIATLVSPLSDPRLVGHPSVVKVVSGLSGDALYFSRLPVPFRRDEGTAPGPTYWRHQGIYAYRPSTLLELCSLPPGQLEQAERLEQLRWLESGYRIRCVRADHIAMGIDHPEDIGIFEQELRARTSDEPS